MPVIQVREVPEHIYRRLVAEAQKERRSLAQQVVAVLARGLDVETDAKARRREVLRAARQNPEPLPKLSDPVRLIREDRER